MFPWDYIGLGVVWTRCFLNMINQLPTLSCTSDGSISQPIPSSPRLDWQDSLVPHPPCALRTSVAHVPAFPWSHPQSGTGQGRDFPLFSYLASFFAFRPYQLISLAFPMLSVRTAPYHHLGQWGREILQSSGAPVCW